MTYWKNTAFVKRDHECTNLVFAETVNGGAPEGDFWQDCGEHMPAEIARLPHCQLLYIQRGVRYYGYL